MRILALDVASKTGWALSHGDAMIASGCWDLTPKRDESRDMRLIRFENKLNEIDKSGVDLVAYEHTVGLYVGAIMVQSELHGILKRWCQMRVPMVQYAAYSAAEIKKFATGKGNAKKDVVLAAVCRRWKVVASEDEADAIALLQLAMESYSKIDRQVIA